MAEEMEMMDEGMPQMNERMVANPQLDMGMPQEANDVVMRPSEGIRNALMMRLTNMTPEELQMLDKAITPQVASVLVKLLPEMQQLIEMVEQGGVGDAMAENEITGSIGGITTSDWWSSEPLLSDVWFYVSPLHRKSRSALILIKTFIKIAKDAKLKIRLGHIYSGDIERKDKFYEKLGLVKAGSTYVEKK